MDHKCHLLAIESADIFVSRFRLVSPPNDSSIIK